MLFWRGTSEHKNLSEDDMGREDGWRTCGRGTQALRGAVDNKPWNTPSRKQVAAASTLDFGPPLMKTDAGGLICNHAAVMGSQATFRHWRKTLRSKKTKQSKKQTNKQNVCFWDGKLIASRKTYLQQVAGSARRYWTSPHQLSSKSTYVFQNQEWGKMWLFQLFEWIYLVEVQKKMLPKEKRYTSLFLMWDDRKQWSL